MKDLIKFAEMALEEVDESLRLLHNEQLEFLGDAVLEYICRLVLASACEIFLR